MSDSDDYFMGNDEMQNELVERFLNSIKYNNNEYFEPEELEIIIEALMQNEDYDNAKHAIDLGLQIYPDNEEILLLNIRYNLDEGLLNVAEKLANEFLNIYPENSEGYYMLGSVYSDMGQHDEAVTMFEKAIDIDPEAEHVFIALSMEYHLSGKYRKAIDSTKQILNKNPDSELAINQLVFIYQSYDEINEAVIFLRDFTDKNPLNHLAWFHLANMLNINNEPYKAIEAYDYALAIEPNFSLAIYGKGRSYMFAGELLKAAECFYETSFVDDLRAVSFLALGDAYSQMNNYSKATEFYLKSIEADPDFVDPEMGLAYCLFMMNLEEEALRHINKVLLKEPGRSEAHHLKGNILVDLDEFYQGILSFRDALKYDKELEDAWLDMSEAYHFVEGPEKAVKVLDEAEEVMENNNPLIAYRKAALLFELGRNQEAISQLFNGLSLDPDLYTTMYSYNEDLEKNEIIQEIVTMFLNQ